MSKIILFVCNKILVSIKKKNIMFLIKSECFYNGERKMSNTKIKDLTTGNPLALIIGFCIPIFFGIIFQQFYNVVDTMIVGRTLGVDALAAVGATGSITFMIVGFCNGIASGFAIPIAQRFGAKDEKGLKLTIANSFHLGIVFSIIITLLVTTQCRTILEFMHTPLNIIDGSYNYLIIIFWGIPITFFFNLFSGIMRSLGNSKTPVLFLSMGCIFNIILDIVLIVYFGMGVEGAGYATVISQFFATLFSGIYMIKKYPVLHMTKEERRADSHCMLQLCYMGLPMGLQYSITAIGSVILQTAVNGLGSAAVASLTSGSKIACFFCAMIDALGSTMATFGGQNVGAKRLDRVTKGLYIACGIGIVYSVFIGIICTVFGSRFALLFVDTTETEIITNVALYLKIESFFYILLTFVNCVRFMIQGMGFSGFAVIAGVMEMIARVVVAMTLVPVYGFKGACFASPVAWILADLFLIPAFFYVRKKLQIRFDSFFV